MEGCGIVWMVLFYMDEICELLVFTILLYLLYLDLHLISAITGRIRVTTMSLLNVGPSIFNIVDPPVRPGPSGFW